MSEFPFMIKIWHLSYSRICIQSVENIIEKIIIASTFLIIFSLMFRFTHLSWRHKQIILSRLNDAWCEWWHLELFVFSPPLLETFPLTRKNFLFVSFFYCFTSKTLSLWWSLWSWSDEFKFSWWKRYGARKKLILM